MLTLHLVDNEVKNVDELGSEHHVQRHNNEPPCFVSVFINISSQFFKFQGSFCEKTIGEMNRWVRPNLVGALPCNDFKKRLFCLLFIMCTLINVIFLFLFLKKLILVLNFQNMFWNHYIHIAQIRQVMKNRLWKLSRVKPWSSLHLFRKDTWFKTFHKCEQRKNKETIYCELIFQEF